MSLQPAYRVGQFDTTQALRMAVDIIDRSGVVDLIQPGLPPQTRRGPKTRLPQYQLRAVLIVMFELAWAGKKLSWPNAAKALWFRYSKKQLALIGLTGWRDSDRSRSMRAALKGAGPQTPAARKAARRMWKAEVQRLQEFADKAFAPIDDTPLPANVRHPQDAYKAARQSTPALQDAHTRQKQVVNALVYASLLHGNAARHPHLDPTNLTDGILKHYTHDVAIDEKEVVVSLGHGRKGTRPVVSIATPFKKVRREKSPDAFGLTIAVAIARPNNRRIPNVALGIALHDPGPGSRQGALDALNAQAVTTTRPPVTGAARHYVIFDEGYTPRDHLNADLIDRGYSAVWKYQSKWITTRTLAPAETGDAPITLFNGRPVCPGMPLSQLRDLDGFDAPDPKESDDVLGPELLAHAPSEALLSAVAMGRNGRPKKAKRPGRGRPAKGTPDLEGHYTVELVCPAIENRARCGIVVDSLALDSTVEDVPAPPRHNQPRCCTNGTQTVRLNPAEVKIFQDKMVGTWDHEDLYRVARARNEAFNARVMDDQNGNLKLGTFTFNKNAPVALATAMTIAVANTHVLLQWDDTLDDNFGQHPWETGRARKRNRASLIAQARIKRPEVPPGP